MNVVFILADQHARAFTGCYGGLTHTPNLDRLAANGVRFTNAWCQSPICAPARASLFAGRYPHELGVWDNTSGYGGSPPGWPHVLRDQGVPLTTIGRLDLQSGGDLGIDDMRHASLHTSIDVTALFREQPIVERRAVYGQYYDIQPRRSGVSLLEADDEPTEAHVTNETVRWIESQRPSDRPWVLYAGYCTPHPKWRPDGELLEKYRARIGPLAPKCRQPVDELHPADQRNALYSCAYMNDDDAQIALFHAAYHAVVEEFDREIGRILSALEDAGILEETLVIYCCDHGESARAHGNLGKCSMYEDSIGVPLIMAGPGMDRGRTESAVVSHLDLFPTIAEAVGLTPPTTLRGRSLLTLLQDRDAAFDEAPVLSEFHAGNANHSAFALRQGAWKLVEHVHEDPILFNLDDDPDEMHDLVRHEPEADGTRRRLQAMQATLRDICDPEAIDAQAKADQRARKQALEAAGRLEEEVYQRGYERNTERLIPWGWEEFKK